MDEWQNIGNGKKIKQIFNNKIIVLAPTEEKTIVPLFCDCCEMPMRTIDDSISFRKNGICSKCDDRWSNKAGIEWPAGPDKTSAEWQNYISQRENLEKPLLIFR